MDTQNEQRLREYLASYKIVGRKTPAAYLTRLAFKAESMLGFEKRTPNQERFLEAILADFEVNCRTAEEFEQYRQELIGLYESFDQLLKDRLNGYKTAHYKSSTTKSLNLLRRGAPMHFALFSSLAGMSPQVDITGDEIEHIKKRSQELKDAYWHRIKPDSTGTSATKSTSAA